MNKKILLIVPAIIVVNLLAFFLRTQTHLPVLQAPAASLLEVTTSFYPLADFAQQIGQQKVTVHNLTPAGAEPHDFEPSPQDLVTLQKSKLFIYNGAGLEHWLDKVTSEPQKNQVKVEASKNIDLLHSSEEDSQTTNSAPDPHVWMDPVLASKQVENIKNGYLAADPANAAYYEQNAINYQKQLADLDTSFREGLADCQVRDIVTSHNAFQYLARRYQLTVASLSGLSPDEEPSPQKMVEVAQFVKKNHVRYIFFESLISPKLAETIAHETGAQTLSFNPLEGLSSNEIAQGKNYISVQKENLTALRTALGCK